MTDARRIRDAARAERAALPPSYTPGRYKAVRHGDGWAVARPSGTLVPGEPVGRRAAQATAERFNDIRRTLAPKG